MQKSIKYSDENWLQKTNNNNYGYFRDRWSRCKFKINVNLGQLLSQSFSHFIKVNDIYNISINSENFYQKSNLVITFIFKTLQWDACTMALLWWSGTICSTRSICGVVLSFQWTKSLNISICLDFYLKFPLNFALKKKKKKQEEKRIRAHKNNAICVNYRRQK